MVALQEFTASLFRRLEVSLEAVGNILASNGLLAILVLWFVKHHPDLGLVFQRHCGCGCGCVCLCVHVHVCVLCICICMHAHACVCVHVCMCVLFFL